MSTNNGEAIFRGPAGKHGRYIDHLARRARLQELQGLGWTIDEMAGDLRIKPKALRWWILHYAPEMRAQLQRESELRIEAQRQKARLKSSAYPYRERISQMIREGKGVVEIADTLGLSRDAVSRTCAFEGWTKRSINAQDKSGKRRKKRKDRTWEPKDGVAPDWDSKERDIEIAA